MKSSIQNICLSQNCITRCDTFSAPLIVLQSNHKKQHTVIKCLVKYPEFVYGPDGLEQLCDGILQEQLWQVQCYWLWIEIVASQGGCLLPSVYSHHIFDNNIISAGDGEKQAISHNPATDPPTLSSPSVFLEWVRYYIFQPCEF